MDIVIDIFDLLLRALISIIYLFFLTKMMGAKQISQLTFFDYVIGISIGSIAAQMAADQELPYVNGLVSMFTYAGVSYILSMLTIKSLKARKFITGTPIILIDKGVLIEQNIKKVKFDINDLLSDLRERGYFNIADIHYAILETNGVLSVLPKSVKRAATPEDLSLTPAQEGLAANLVIDGRIIKENLNAVNKDEAWLYKEIEKQNIPSLKEILLLTCDNNYNVSIYLKNSIEIAGNKFD